ncbi:MULTISPECIES: hypothetical protein [Ectothiorhodospira]|nr:MULTISPECIES: hypothetical protein [Ectothiorhodospira]MCG5494172.1 hypothetical protein [Ectothiorhodospira variabilis]MCG5497403.1 hypothetical protein [Ectothiorhodospira variabilis]MCG5503298.1 hypothetical protein [Ectothiorhodospira variabilis]MCG5506614.1 hypothetical protein [Ectothiorhodospira variabilis]MCG5524174.1 hypothetical protein [Ectothiorhodospira haloalkaliphila]
MVIRHPDPMAMLLQAMPIVAMVVYGTIYLRQFLDGYPPPLANLAILIALGGMSFYALWRLSPFTLYRFRHSPAHVAIEKQRLVGRNPLLEHDLSRVQRISIERYPFNRGYRYVVCMHLADGRRIVEGMPDAPRPEPIYDFAVRVARFYGVAEGPGGPPEE